MARVSGMVDTVLNTEGRTTQSVLQEVSKTAIERAVTAGAVRNTVEIAEMDAIPIPVSLVDSTPWFTSVVLTFLSSVCSKQMSRDCQSRGRF